MSDHLSSARVVADPASDICDLYAFPSPERPGRLVLIMTVYPRATPETAFDEGVLCRFRLRRASITRSHGERARFAVGDDELIFDCTFSGHEVRCETYTHHTVTAKIGDRVGAEDGGLRLFAGLVSDPFIFQIESIVETLKTGRMMFGTTTANTMQDADTLGLVVELDAERWLGAADGAGQGGSMVAVVGETLAIGSRPVRLERVGRPEIKNIGLQWNGNDTVNRDIDLRDLYNQEDAFQVRDHYLGAYRARLDANLRFYDGLDGTIDWPPGEDGRHPLVDLLLQDYLVVDLAMPYSLESWFEIERAMLAGRSHQTCGGRTLNDDFLDRYYTLFINAGNGPRVSDGVDAATVPAGDRFPYLAPPNAGESP